MRTGGVEVVGRADRVMRGGWVERAERAESHGSSDTGEGRAGAGMMDASKGAMVAFVCAE